MYHERDRMDNDRREKIKALLAEAEERLSSAAELSAGFDDYFYFEALGYGAGASLIGGEWMPSSLSC